MFPFFQSKSIHTHARPQRVYQPPEVRRKTRYVSFEEAEETLNQDNVIDKYDYLLVFPVTEGLYTTDHLNFDETEWIEWEDVSSIWKAAIPGTDDVKEDAVQILASHWHKRTGSFPKKGDSMKKLSWLTIARETIVEQLMQRSGLQLKIIGTTKYILCCVRAPLKLLELQADDENYKLQFRGEIDPGTEEFWNREIIKNGEKVAPELEEESIVYEKDEANVVLEKLYEAKKLNPIDLGVNTAKETDVIWSRRIHALERIADRVPVYNKYPAFAVFSTDPHKRYLFEVYTSSRGKSLFLPKDRIYLTKAILDRYFDLEKLAVDHILNVFTALHSANRGEEVTNEALVSRWVTFWRVSIFEVGAPMVTHPAYYHQEPAPLHLYPFCQPFYDIRNYFGEKIALYYAWIGFYSYYLIFPSLLGVALELIWIYRGYEETNGHIDWILVGYVVIMVIWNVFYKNGWDREQKAIALKWGTAGFESTEKDLPSFRGDPECPLKRSPVTNENETYYPESKRMKYYLYTSFMVILAVLVSASLSGGIFYAEALVVNQYTQYEFAYFTLVVNVVQALQIQFGFYYFRFYSNYLNDSENHRTETDYETALISKSIVFQVVNNFGVTLFTAFGKEYVLHSCTGSCLSDLRQLLLVIIVLRVSMSMIEAIWPLFRNLYRRIRSYFEDEIELEMRQKEEAINIASETQILIDEIELDEAETTFDDYAALVLQYGYITFYSVALPLLSIFACVENLIKIRMDAYRMCVRTRRPHVMLAEDTGMWGDQMDQISVVGVIVTSAIVCITENSLDNYPFITRLIYFLAFEQILLVIKYTLEFFYGDDVDWIEDIRRRNEFIVSKYAEDFTDDDGGDGEIHAGNVENQVDVEKQGIYDIRQSKPFSEDDYARLEDLQVKRREEMLELNVLKNQLRNVNKLEVLNEVTGIGETRHGLPLGRLSVKVIEIQEFLDKQLIMPRHKILVRVLIKGYNQRGPPAGPPYSKEADTKARRIDSEGRVEFNQVLGPFAPIRTQDADVTFDIIDKHNRSSNDLSLATATVRLRDLLDQKTHNEVVNLLLRLDDGTMKSSKARLFVSLVFHYSKVVPIRNKICAVQDRIRTLDHQINEIKERK